MSLYLLATLVRIVGYGCVIWFLVRPPAAFAFRVLGAFFTVLCLQKVGWFADEVFGWATPGWFRSTLVWFEAVGIIVAYAVLRYGTNGPRPQRRRGDHVLTGTLE